MSGRSSHRNKTQPAGQATGPGTRRSHISEDVSKAAETDTSNEDNLPASGTQHTLEAHADNKQRSSSDNSTGAVSKNASKKNTAGERTGASERSKKTTENSEPGNRQRW